MNDVIVRPKLTVYESLMVCRLQGTLSFEGLRLMSDWLDNCREYVPPRERVLEFALRDLLAPDEKLSHTKNLFNAWLLSDSIECSLTRESQERIISWMRE